MSLRSSFHHGNAIADERQPPMTAQKRWTMLAVILGSGIVFLDSTVVNLALKRIGQDLPSSLFGVLEGQSYVSNAYLLTLSALLILAGALNDYFGRRRMFFYGLIAFGATSLLCGVAPNLELLVLFRILQGAAGAILVPGSLSIITATFHGEEQGRAFGIWAGASAATTILGPFIGGLLVNSISWRAAFFINVPLVVVAGYAMRYVQESRDEEASGNLDWLGAGVVALAVGGLAFGTIRGQQSNWSGAVPFIALAVGAVAAVAFPIMMKRSSNPLVPPHLFRSRNFTVTNISTFVIYGALYVTFAFSGIFLVGTLGYNEPAAGFAGVPGTLFLALFSARFGGLAARYGPRAFMAVGPAVMGLGLLWLVRIPFDSKPWLFGTGADSSLLPPSDYFVDVLPGLVLFGIGLMIMVAPLTTALMTSVPTRNSGVASAINNAISRVGSPLVGAVMFVAIAASFYGTIADHVPDVNVDSPEFRKQVSPLNPPDEDVSPAVQAVATEASTDAFHLAMLVAAGLLFIGAAVNGVGITNRPVLEMARKAEEKPEAEAVMAGQVAPVAAEAEPACSPPCLPVPAPVTVSLPSGEGGSRSPT
jgi:EmrB/QacA subfamily drug resistance transporter